ncbi:MAG TPA: D-aminoacylase [Vicinamibacterales bacterium]|nr:D-aminoacylase [Vicinamibacterales bacterium]
MKKTSRLAFLVAALVSVSATPFQQPAAYDLVIRGGRILDGSGNPWFYGDVAVKDGRIAAVGALTDARAARVIDATGKFVTPGFIDLHSHSDGGLASMELRHSPNMVAQGITLSVVNQDGRSPRWPIRDQKALYEKQGIGTNAVLMVGHGTVRTRVMGQRDTQVATDADIAAMQKLVDEGMRDGAAGLSTGLEYDPGRFSETREVVALTRVVKPYGGFYISHERSEGADPMWKVASDPTPFVSLLDAVQETITIGRDTGVRVVASHLKAKGQTYWGSSVAATRLIRDARAQGVEVYADQYPYETSGTDGNTVLVPGWALLPPGQTSGNQLSAGGRGAGAGVRDRFKARLAIDDDVRKIRIDIAHEIDRRGGAARIIINEFPDPKYVNKSLQFIADDLKMPPLDAVIWLQLNGADRAGGARMRGFSLAEIDMDEIIKQDFTATCTDGDTVRFGQGTPHARFYGTMPRKIRHYVLDRKVIELPFAIRSMTSLPAQIIGLKDRGLLRAGNWADLVVFDPNTIADTATFTEPHQYPTGIPFVFVNGVAVVDNGKITGATPGKVLTPR